MPEDLVDRLFSELASADLPVPARSRVIARGRQRRRHARAGAASAAAVAVAVAAGVSQLPASRPGGQPVQHHHGAPAAAVCPAAPDAALTAELAAASPLSSQAGVWPLGVSQDGSVVYAETTVGGFHGIAAENLATGAIVTKIKALPASYTGAHGGLGPNGDVIWSSTYNTHGGQGNAGMTPVELWSPRTGRITTLEPAGQHGGALSAPVIFPATREFAAWEQQDGGKQEIVEADLASRATMVIATGYFGPPVFAGNALVWPVAGHKGGPAASLAARDATSFPARQRVAVPPSLRGAAQSTLMGSSGEGSYWPPVGLIASDGQATAFISQNLTQLFFSPSPSVRARLVLPLNGGNTFAAGAPVVGPGYLGWTINGVASYLASASSFAAARITTFGLEFSAGSRVFVMGYSGVKTQPASNPFHLFTGSVVSSLKCVAPAKRASS
jgi:hypothetical protein